MELQNPDLTPENCPRTWEGRSLTAHGDLVLNHIPVFDQNPVLDAYDVGCNPVHRLAEARKPPMHDFEISMEAIWKSNWNK
ncbi:MAG: hypothetical protein AUH25_02220 [Thaumarchaeota archaeon 13_1_40CM_38_12]|nr:MAG: hypothetical protein AUH25_02220 [Thaumarchaeota archaeon 13_1_40CM_38_12]